MKHYRVQWKRPLDDETYECHKLPPRVLIRRIKDAVRNYGAVQILLLEEEK